MPIGFKKGLKPLFIQRLALLVGICYLMNPLQQEIKSAFHTISHALEVPNSVIGHHSNSENDINHGHFEHETADIQHDHSFIDLLDSVFLASNESNDSDDSILVKIDKHLTVYQFQLLDNLAIVESSNYWSIKEKLKSGYFKNQKEPPKDYHN